MGRESLEGPDKGLTPPPQDGRQSTAAESPAAPAADVDAPQPPHLAHGRLRPTRPVRRVSPQRWVWRAAAIGVAMLAMVVFGRLMLHSTSLPVAGDAGGGRPVAADASGPAVPSASLRAEIPLPAQPGTSREIVVDPKGGGDARSIAEAIDAAPPGSSIRIRPGIYTVGITLDKDVRLLGMPEDPGLVSVVVAEQPCLRSRAASASIAGLSLRNEGQSGEPCVLVTAGNLRIDDVAIGSGTGDGLAVEGNAEVSGQRLRIQGTGRHGLTVRNGGRLLLEDSDIEASGSAGVQLVNSGVVTLRDNRINGGGATGIVVADGSRATLINNVVTQNAWSGIEILRTRDAVVAGNIVTGNREAGLYLNRKASGDFVGNRFIDNGFSGVVVAESSGSFENNEMGNNADHGVYLTRDGTASLVGNLMFGNRGHGIAVDSGSSARINANDVTGNRRNPQIAGTVLRTK